MVQRPSCSDAILLRGMPWGSVKYLTTLSRHPTVANALAWGAISGLSADGQDRLGRLWIERHGAPATLDKHSAA